MVIKQADQKSAISFKSGIFLRVVFFKQRL